MDVTRKRIKGNNGRKKRRKRFLKNYFKNLMGMTSGTFQGDSSLSRSIGACLLAYAHVFFMPESSWTGNTIDNILKSELDWELPEDLPADTNITILFEKHLVSFSVEGITPEAFQVTHKSNTALLFVTDTDCCVLWTKKEHLGIFTFIPSQKSLILLSNFDDMIKLFPLEPPCRLYRITITQLEERTDLEDVQEINDQVPERGFLVINEDLAILRGSLHLKLPSGEEEDETREKHGLFIGYTAAIYAQRIPLKSWDSDMLDEVIRVSENLSRKPLKISQRKFTYLINCGGYQAYLNTEISFYAGVQDILEDIHRLRGFLEKENTLIVEFEGVFWTLLKQSLFYLLNPFELTSLEMHRDMQGILQALAEVLNEDTKIVLHVVKITSVEDVQNHLDCWHGVTSTISSPGSTPTEELKSPSSWDERRKREIYESFKLAQERRKLKSLEKAKANQEHEKELEEEEKRFRKDERKRQRNEERQKRAEKRQIKEMVKEMRRKRKEIQLKLENIEKSEGKSSSLLLSNIEDTSQESEDSQEVMPPQNSPDFKLEGLKLEGLGSAAEDSNNSSEEKNSQISTSREDLQEIPTSSSGENSEIQTILTDGTYNVTKENPAEIPKLSETTSVSSKFLKDYPKISEEKQYLKVLDGGEEIQAIPTGEIRNMIKKESPDLPKSWSNVQELPGKQPSTDLIVLQSVTGRKESLSKLLRQGLTMSSNRFLITTPGKRFLIIQKSRILHLYTGCICNIEKIPKEIDNQANFLSFHTIEDLIEHILVMNLKN
ncbi:hypothetical protein DMENIID0001_075860 [Sergentomyia squamirostris]